jgi:hypothetical protein
MGLAFPYSDQRWLLESTARRRLSYEKNELNDPPSWFDYDYNNSGKTQGAFSEHSLGNIQLFDDDNDKIYDDNDYCCY